VTVSSPNDISEELRRLKNVKFGTKVVSSTRTRMMCALKFLERVLIAAKIAKSMQKNMPEIHKMSNFFSTC